VLGVEIEDTNDAGAFERHGDPRFVGELVTIPLGLVVDLQRHVAAELAIHRLVDGGRASSTHLTQQIEGGIGLARNDGRSRGDGLLFEVESELRSPAAVSLARSGVIEITQENAFDEGERVRKVTSPLGQIGEQQERRGR
jgi:hypothetical protein